MKPLSQHIQEAFVPQQEEPMTETIIDKLYPEDAEEKPSDDGTAPYMRTEPSKG